MNFISSTLPLGYWFKLGSLLHTYVWSGKRCRITLSTLQNRRADGGWACSNFQLYHWSFKHRPMSHWFDANTQPAWKKLEQGLIVPSRRDDFLSSSITVRKCSLYYRPMHCALRPSKAEEKFLQIKNTQSPILNDNNL